jgi:hypothetical protein
LTRSTSINIQKYLKVSPKMSSLTGFESEVSPLIVEQGIVERVRKSSIKIQNCLVSSIMKSNFVRIRTTLTLEFGYTEW